MAAVAPSPAVQDGKLADEAAQAPVPDGGADEAGARAAKGSAQAGTPGQAGAEDGEDAEASAPTSEAGVQAAQRDAGPAEVSAGGAAGASEGGAGGAAVEAREEVRSEPPALQPGPPAEPSLLRQQQGFQKEYAAAGTADVPTEARAVEAAKVTEVAKVGEASDAAKANQAPQATKVSKATEGAPTASPAAPLSRDEVLDAVVRAELQQTSSPFASPVELLDTTSPAALLHLANALNCFAKRLASNATQIGLF